MLRRLFPRWFTQKPQAVKSSRPSLRMLELEAREVPSVTLRDVPDQSISNSRPTYLPITITNVPGLNGTPTFSATGGTGLTAEVISNPGRTVRFDVVGKDTSGTDFAGTISIQLFEDVAPLATQRIIDLVDGGYYVGKTFHRISGFFSTVNDFIVQGGSPTGNGVGGSNLGDIVDEYNSQYTFASTGIVAMANAGDDGNDAQFFITQPDVPFQNRPQFLNFNHTIVGLMTAGFDTYSKMLTTVSPPTTTPTFALTITGATVFQDKNNAVVKLTPNSSFTGPVSVTLRATDGDGSTTDSVLVTPASEANNPVASNRNSRAILGPVTNQTMFAGSSLQVPFTATDIDGDSVTLAVRDSGDFLNPPPNMTFSINQTTGIITFTPNAGFVGTLTFKVGARDQFNRSTALDDAGNFDTQLMSITVLATPSLSLNLSNSSVNTGDSVTFTANLSNAGSNPTGTVVFFDGSTALGSAPVSSGLAAFTTSFLTAGTRSITAAFTPTNQTAAVATSETEQLTITTPTVPPTVPPVVPPVTPPVTPPPTTNPVPADFTAVGSAAGSPPTISVFNSDGSLRYTVPAFESTFTGGVTVAVGDVTGDGVADVIAVPGYGGGAVVKVFDSNTGEVLNTILVFESSFRGGLNLAVGDPQNLGRAQIIVGAGLGGAPRVQILDVSTSSTISDYFAHDVNLRGGVSVALSDLIVGEAQRLITSGFASGRVPQAAIFNTNSTTALGTSTAGSAVPEPVLQLAPISARAFLGSFVPSSQEILPQGVRVIVGNPEGAEATVRPLFVSTYDPLATSNTVALDPTSFVDANELRDDESAST